MHKRQGIIKEQEELTLQTPESFWDRFRIDVRVRQEVTAINPTEKTVTVHALDSGKVYKMCIRDSYRALLHNVETAEVFQSSSGDGCR